MVTLLAAISIGLMVPIKLFCWRTERFQEDLGGIGAIPLPLDPVRGAKIKFYLMKSPGFSSRIFHSGEVSPSSTYL